LVGDSIKLKSLTTPAQVDISARTFFRDEGKVTGLLMAALGQKQTYAAQNDMSALLPPIATSNATYGDVRFGPIVDISV
jgi:hypothetical protein